MDTSKVEFVGEIGVTTKDGSTLILIMGDEGEFTVTNENQEYLGEGSIEGRDLKDDPTIQLGDTITIAPQDGSSAWTTKPIIKIS